jgi:hypothetical protein
MRPFVTSLILALLLVGCVSSTKYAALQNELKEEKAKSDAYKTQSNALLEQLMKVKSDYNNLDFEYSQSEKYGLFTDKELAKALKVSEVQKEQLERDLKVAHREAVFYSAISIHRAEAFAEEATCKLLSYSDRKLVLRQNNMVYLDLDGMLAIPDMDAAALKALMAQVLEPMKLQKDWSVNICLNVSEVNTDWHKLKMQQEVMAFMVAGVGLPYRNLSGKTHYLPQQKSPDFGYFAKSGLLLEVEFKG